MQHCISLRITGNSDSLLCLRQRKKKKSSGLKFSSGLHTNSNRNRRENTDRSSQSHDD